jgi:hypothetical protein
MRARGSLQEIQNCDLHNLDRDRGRGRGRVRDRDRDCDMIKILIMMLNQRSQRSAPFPQTKKVK